MKELEIKPGTETGIHAEQRIEYKQIGAQKYVKGLTLFEFEFGVNILRRASYEDVKPTKHFDRTDTLVTRKKVVIKPNCFYIQALNAKNGAKKINKLFGVSEINIEN